MKRKEQDQAETYFAQGETWAADRERQQRRSQQLAWWAAGAATVIALAEALALVALAPLRTVVPYTLLVDRQTGYVQALDPVNGEKITPDAALTRSFLVQYVIARESFLFEAVQQNYRKTALWSQGDVRSRYVAAMQASNPTSPLAVYPRRTIVEVQVSSVSALTPGMALVRFRTLRTDPGGQPRPNGTWIATIRYHYSGEPMSAEDRLINPLGFSVTQYQKDIEVLPEVLAPNPVAPQTASAPAPTVVGAGTQPTPVTGGVRQPSAAPR